MVKHILKLTILQRKFIENYLRHGNAKRAALQAGYAEGDLAKTVRGLMKHPIISNELEKARKHAEKKAAYNYETAMQESKEGMELARDTENAGAFVNAAKLRAQLTGLLVEKHQIQAGFSVQISGIDDVKQVTEVVPQIAAGDVMSLIGGEDEEDE